MRFVRLALLAAPLLCGPALAAADDAQILDDLTVVTATPRPSDVKMVVQTVRPPSEAGKTASQPQSEAAAPIKTASK